MLNELHQALQARWPRLNIQKISNSVLIRSRWSGDVLGVFSLYAEPGQGSRPEFRVSENAGVVFRPSPKNQTPHLQWCIEQFAETCECIKEELIEHRPGWTYDEDRALWFFQQTDPDTFVGAVECEGGSVWWAYDAAFGTIAPKDAKTVHFFLDQRSAMLAVENHAAQRADPAPQPGAT